ncbi:MAG TPA: class I poly(R)-hydroxyalkanoic acid synthase, partial [Pseudolabrys sp.]|nr:class I poly(R)-hydroxyalkanoic acid synthase [Pseudolabrys sp.]
MRMDKPTAGTAQPKQPSRAQPPVESAKPDGQGPKQLTSVDVEVFSRNLARLVEEGGKTLAAYMKPREEGKIKGDSGDQIADIVRTLAQVLEYWLADPQRTVELQTGLGAAFLDLWGAAARRLAGEPSAPVVSADPKDKRFSDPEW